MDYLFKIESVDKKNEPAPKTVPVTQIDFSGMMSKSRVEDSLVNSFAEISQRYYNADPNYAKKIVDNIKSLIDHKLDESMIDVESLCDNVATISEQMIEIKDKIDQMATVQQKCIDDSYALLKSIKEERDARVKAEAEYDCLDSIAFKAFVYSVPIAIALIALAIHQSM